MKLSLCVLGVFICLFYMGLCPWPVSAQYYRNPKLYFKKLKFDMEIRGTYNITQCISDNMNCWEVVKPDLVCKNLFSYGSTCDVLLEYCHDQHPDIDQDDYWYSMQVQEMWCNDWEAFTK